MACHFNGAGGGALSDYGRALYAGELAARPFWSSKSDEQLAESSAFLGSIQSPVWLKPGIKFRNLHNIVNPGSKSKIEKTYVMQADLNLAFFTSEEGTRGIVTTFSHVPEVTRATPNKPLSPSSEFMAKEYYLRWGFQNGDWIYAGFMDKVFGIRHPDHTAVNRSAIGLGQNDQVHGLTWQRPSEKSDLFIQGFLGNTHLPKAEQATGLSLFYEREVAERFRPGVSFLQESSDSLKQMLLAGHLRVGIEKGHALLYELGLKEIQQTGLEKELGLYQFMEFSYFLTRGYHFQSILQMEKPSFESTAMESYRWGFGLLALPFQRGEFRLQALQARRRMSNTVPEDQWVAQAQWHWSL